MSDEHDFEITAEQVAAATGALAEILRMFGARKAEPGALYGLCALLGATLLRYTDYTTGQIIDFMHAYAEDDAMVQAVGEVLRKEGMIGADLLPSEEPPSAASASGAGKPN